MAQDWNFEFENELTMGAMAAILRMLFIDRADVYAIQVKTAEGCIYQPVWEDLDDEILMRHLRGEITVGIYPGTEKTRWLAIDVDSREPAKVKAVLEAIRKFGVEAYLEDSGKKGFHVVLFFSQPIPNWKARQIGHAVCCGNEAWPKQDKIEKEKGQVGNLMKLCVGINRDSGRRCLFVDENLVPFPGQLAFLQSIKRCDGESLWEKIPKEEARAHGGRANRGTAPTVRMLKPCVKRILASGVGQGLRNNAAFLISSEARRLQLTFKEALVMLKVWNFRNKPPLGDQEIMDVVRSAYSADYEFGCDPDSTLRSVVECMGKDRCSYYRALLKETKKVLAEEKGKKPEQTPEENEKGSEQSRSVA